MGSAPIVYVTARSLRRQVTIRSAQGGKGAGYTAPVDHVYHVRCCRSSAARSVWTRKYKSLDCACERASSHCDNEYFLRKSFASFARPAKAHTQGRWALAGDPR